MASEVENGKPSTGKQTAGIIGALAFFVGFILAIICGFSARNNGTVTLVLLILGIIVAFLNIKSKEVTTVMIAAIALVVAGGANIFSPLDSIIDGLGRDFNGVITYLAGFMLPVAIISAIRAVIAVARPDE